MTPSAGAERDATAPSPLDVGFDKEDHDDRILEATRLYGKGRYEDALTRFDAAGPAPGRLHMHLGNRSGVLHKLGRDEEAYDEALRGLVETQEGAKDATLWRRLKNAANALAERGPDHFPRLARSMPSLDDSHAALLALARTARAEGITEADVVFETILDPEEPETIPGGDDDPGRPQGAAPRVVFSKKRPRFSSAPRLSPPAGYPARSRHLPDPPKEPLPATSTPAVVALEALAADVHRRRSRDRPSGTIAPGGPSDVLPKVKRKTAKLRRRSALASFRASARTHGCACVLLPADLRDALDAAALACGCSSTSPRPRSGGTRRSARRRRARRGRTAATDPRTRRGARAPASHTTRGSLPRSTRLARRRRRRGRAQERLPVALGAVQLGCDAHQAETRREFAGDARSWRRRRRRRRRRAAPSEFVGDGSEDRRRSDDARESSRRRESPPRPPRRRPTRRRRRC